MQMWVSPRGTPAICGSTRDRQPDHREEASGAVQGQISSTAFEGSAHGTTRNARCASTTYRALTGGPSRSSPRKQAFPQADRSVGLLVVLGVVSPGLMGLQSERLPVGNTATQELWPWRNRDVGFELFGECPPEVWMMPAKVMPRAVAVRPYGLAELEYLGEPAPLT